MKRLKSKPEVVKQLTKYNDDVGKIRQMNLAILPLTLDIVARSETVRTEEGLLTNDSLVVAFMRDTGLSKLATTDGDFGRIDGLDVYRPADV